MISEEVEEGKPRGESKSIFTSGRSSLKPKPKPKKPKVETFESVQAQVKDYSSVADTLRKKQDFIEQQIQQEEKTHKLLEDYIQQKRDELSTMKKNLKMAYEIEDLTARIK